MIAGLFLVSAVSHATANEEAKDLCHEAAMGAGPPRVGATFENILNQLDTGQQRCGSQQCQAARDIRCAISAINHTNVANTMGYDTKRQADLAFARHSQLLRSFGRLHPQRDANYCRLLTEAASIAAPGDAAVYYALRLGTMLDATGFRCVAAIIAKLKFSPESEEMALRAREDCSDWSGSVCARIRLPNPATPGSGKIP